MNKSMKKRLAANEASRIIGLPCNHINLKTVPARNHNEWEAIDLMQESSEADTEEVQVELAKRYIELELYWKKTFVR